MNSIIIISKGQEARLMSSLIGIKNQEKFYQSWEVVLVIYDMSKELRKFILSLNISYRLNIIEASTDFNRSNARNIGANAARGDFLVFCDNDMVLTKTFFRDFEKKNIVLNSSVGIHPMLGYKLNDKSTLGEYFKKNSSDSEMLELVKDEYEVIDYRTTQILNYENNLNKMPFPWVLCWSALFSISKKNFNMAGGFDIGFESWGGEDTDFAIRCFNKELGFCYLDNIYGFHIPHVTMSNETNFFELRKTLFNKHPSIGTELLQYMTGLAINSFYEGFKNLKSLNPVYPLKFLQTILKNINGHEKILLVGISRKNLPTEFQHFDYLEQFIGLSTTFKNKEYDKVIVFDSYRFLPSFYLNKVYDELLRISFNVEQIITSRYFEDEEFYKNDKIEYINF